MINTIVSIMVLTAPACLAGKAAGRQAQYVGRCLNIIQARPAYTNNDTPLKLFNPIVLYYIVRLVGLTLRVLRLDMTK